MYHSLALQQTEQHQAQEVDLDALFSLPPKIGQVIVTVLGEFPSNDSKFNEFQFRNRIKPYVPLSLICYTLIATIGLVLNLNLVRYIIRIKPTLSYSHRHLYTLLLGNSINDMLIKDVIVLPISYVILTSVHWTLGQSFCRLFPLLQDSCFHVTSLTFLFAFYTRYKHISNAHFNSVTNDVKHVKNETAVISAIHPAIILIICWVISICGVIPHTVFITYIDLGHYLGPLFHGSGVCVVNIEDNIAEYIRFLFALFYLIPIVMTISYHFKCVDIISRWTKSSEEYRGRGVAIVHRGSIVENVSYTHSSTLTTITSTNSSGARSSDRNHNIRSSITSINNSNQVPKTKLLLTREPIDEGDENEGEMFDEDEGNDDNSLVIRNLNTDNARSVHALPSGILSNERDVTFAMREDSPGQSTSLIQRSQSVRVPRTTFSNKINSHVYEVEGGGKFKRNSLQPTMLNDYSSQQQSLTVHPSSSNLHHRPSISRQLPSLSHLTPGQQQHLSPSSPTVTVGQNNRSGSIVTTSSDGTSFLVTSNARSTRASSLCVVRNNDSDLGFLLPPTSSSSTSPLPTPHSTTAILISPSSSFASGRNDYYHQHHPSFAGTVVPSSSAFQSCSSNVRSNHHQQHRPRSPRERMDDLNEQGQQEEEMYQVEGAEEDQNGSLFLGYQSQSPSSASFLPGNSNSRTRSASASFQTTTMMTGNNVPARSQQHNLSLRMNSSKNNARIAHDNLSSSSGPTPINSRSSISSDARTQRDSTTGHKYSSNQENRRKVSNLSSSHFSGNRGEGNSVSRIENEVTTTSTTTRRKSSGFDEFQDLEEGDKLSNLALEESLQKMLLTIFLIYSILLLPLNVLRFTKNLLPEPPGMAIVFDLIFIVSIGTQFMTTLVIPIVIQKTSKKLFDEENQVDQLSHLRSSTPTNNSTNYGSSIMIASNNRFAKNYGQQSSSSSGHRNHQFLSANQTGTSPSPSTTSFSKPWTKIV